ncbi:MAG: cell division protein SepF [Candidatus Bathyarchaeota archaeon]|nr:cell division protein SepF [Candidatus Bathyarchaeota archaeon]
MPTLGIFRKPKREEDENAAVTEAPPETAEVPAAKTYLKAMPLRDLADLENIKAEVKNGNILILRITPLANKSIDDVKQAVTALTEFATSISGDIARLGEERVVLCPPNVRIWREKTPVSNEPLPTAA